MVKQSRKQQLAEWVSDKYWSLQKSLNRNCVYRAEKLRAQVIKEQRDYVTNTMYANGKSPTDRGVLFQCAWPPMAHRSSDCKLELTLRQQCQKYTSPDLDVSVYGYPLWVSHIPCTVNDAPCECIDQILEHLALVHGVPLYLKQDFWYCSWEGCTHQVGGAGFNGKVKLAQHVLAAHLIGIP